jgi:CubicO group peptidase (beta-lactamase class C family)
MPRLAARLAAGALALTPACSTPPRPTLPPAPPPPPSRLTRAAPAAVGMSGALPRRLDSLMRAAIVRRATPGAALVVARHGRVVVDAAWGRQSWAADAPAVTDSTLYDLASLTKVVATTTAAMLLEDDGRLDLDRPVASYLPAFGAPDKAGVTVRMLLLHTSGMQQEQYLYRELRGREQYLQRINAKPLAHPPGTHTEYADWNMMVLQGVVERVAGQPLDALLAARVFGPLGMRDTRFNPPAALRPRIAPTEVQPFRGGLVWGVVHDENAWAMGGVSGNAGLFSSARDLAVFAELLLDGGAYAGVRLLRPETVARWTARQTPASSRALGWDTPAPRSSAGRFFSPRAFGHTGYTGTSLWVDPERGLFVLLLTNRVHPTRENAQIGPLRREVADLVQGAVVDAPVRDWEGRR